MHTLSVTILGSSAAMPLFGRHNASQIVRAGKQMIMIDCGDGTTQQCIKYGISLHKLDMIVISHLHGDHFLGLMSLLNIMHMAGRTQKLLIFAPRDLQEVLRLQLNVTSTVLRYELIFTALSTKTETIFEDDTLTIQTIPLNHRITPCNGFLFREKPKRLQIKSKTLPAQTASEAYTTLKSGQDVLDESGKVLYKWEEHTFQPPAFSYAYCSDTAYFPPILELIQGVDLLYHEATFLHEDLEKATKTYHSTAHQAGEVALQARVGKLLIGHISAKYPEHAPLLAEAKTIFKSTAFAVEGETFTC